MAINSNYKKRLKWIREQIAPSPSPVEKRMVDHIIAVREWVLNESKTVTESSETPEEVKPNDRT